MPSLEHGALVEMFRSNPELIPRLLQHLGVAVPAFDTLTVSEAAVDQLTPIEFRADLVVELRAAGSERAELGAILEVQLSPDDAKRYSWPAYMVLFRARNRCDTCVVVLAPDPAVAAWARRPIRIGPGNELGVHVIGPAQIPTITDPDEAAADPALTVLSAIAHGNEPEHGLTVLQLAVDALKGFDKPDARVYLHLIEKALGEPMRAAMQREIMLREKYTDEELNLPEGWWEALEWRWARNRAIKAIKAARAEGKPVVMDEVLAAVMGEEKAEGKTEGKAEGKAEVLLKILASRGIALTPEQTETIATCVDPKLVDAWVDRAFTATTAADLFG